MDREKNDSTEDQLEVSASELPKASVMALIENSPIASVVSNPRLPDNPIVAVNKAFIQLTGYDSEFIIGRNCRFLAGEATEPWLTEEIRRGATQVGIGRDTELQERRHAIPECSAGSPLV